MASPKAFSQAPSSASSSPASQGPMFQHLTKLRKEGKIRTSGGKGAKVAKKAKPKTPPKGQAKVQKVMGEFKSQTLKSGSATGPTVSNPKQAIAIALSEARKASK